MHLNSIYLHMVRVLWLGVHAEWRQATAEIHAATTAPSITPVQQQLAVNSGTAARPYHWQWVCGARSAVDNCLSTARCVAYSMFARLHLETLKDVYSCTPCVASAVSLEANGYCAELQSKYHNRRSQLQTEYGAVSIWHGRLSPQRVCSPLVCQWIGSSQRSTAVGWWAVGVAHYLICFICVGG